MDRTRSKQSLSLTHGEGGARHPQVLAGQHPDGQHTAPQLHPDILPGIAQAQLGGGRHTGAGAGAAGPGLSAAPFPHPHLEPVRSKGLDKLGVDLPGEIGMLLKGGADGRKVQAVHVGHHHHTVGVAHTDTGDAPVAPRGMKRTVHQRAGPHVHSGQAVGQQAVPAHLHLPQPLTGIAPLSLPAQGLGPAAGVNEQGIRPGQVGIVGAQPLGHAADAVAAHHPLAAVGIVNAHGGRSAGGLWGADADHAVRTYRNMPGRQLPGKRRNVRRGAPGAAVQVDIIVGAALHFGETQSHGLIPFRCPASYYNGQRPFWQPLFANQGLTTTMAYDIS